MSRDIWKSWGAQGHPGLHSTCAEACIPSARNIVPLVIEANTPSTQVPERPWGRCCFQRHALCRLRSSHMSHWLRQPPAKPSSGLPCGGDCEVPTRWIWTWRLPGQPPGPRPCPGEAPGSASASARWLAGSRPVPSPGGLWAPRAMQDWGSACTCFLLCQALNQGVPSSNPFPSLRLSVPSFSMGTSPPFMDESWG